MNQRSSLTTRTRRPLGRWTLLACGSVFMFGGCTVMGTKEAPIVEWSVPARAAPTQVVGAQSQASHVQPLHAEAGTQTTQETTAGTYTVQPGDTLYSIALAFGQDAGDIMRWNQLTDPTQLDVGRMLVVAPGGVVAARADAGTAATPVALGGAIESRPLDEGAPGGIPDGTADLRLPSPAPAAVGTVVTPQQDVVVATPAAPKAQTQHATDWIWPVAGAVMAPFNAESNKGVDIAGQEGAPVVAAKDGQVVYSGNSLRGYGNLVILKHNDEFVSAYAHNQEILVKKGQTVKRGQLIAKLGRTDADSPRLHFEIRRQGKPVDPTSYLPVRP